MNLWHLFPESLLHIPGILQLPYLSYISFYFMLFSDILQSVNSSLSFYYLALQRSALWQTIYIRDLAK